MSNLLDDNHLYWIDAPKWFQKSDFSSSVQFIEPGSGNSREVLELYSLEI